MKDQKKKENSKKCEDTKGKKYRGKGKIDDTVKRCLEFQKEWRKNEAKTLRDNGWKFLCIISKRKTTYVTKLPKINFLRQKIY